MRCVALLLVALAVPALAQERVVDFHSDIRIARDGTLTVTERIDVQVEGREIKRGILRDFPTDYRDRMGARVKVSRGQLKVHDGPFAESKEVIGGFAIFEFATKEEALAAAVEFMDAHRAHWPGWEGECEVRAMMG